MFILSPGCLASPDNSLLTVKRTTLSFIACSFMLPSSPLDVNFLLLNILLMKKRISLKINLLFQQLIRL